MTAQRLAIGLTVVNLLLMAFLVPRIGSAAQVQVAPVLRARALEIVDESGKKRAEIVVLAPSTMDGKTYPETVLFRLIDPNGRPAVKIAGSVDGSAMSLAGDSEKREWNGAQILAEGRGGVVKLTNKDGRQQIIKP
jgi:hypothetical protein